MRLLGTQFIMKTRTFEIYLAGCKGSPHCKGCHNPESWSFDRGIEVDRNALVDKINEHSHLISKIHVLGGEPLDQPLFDLQNLCKALYRCNKEMWLFTRYEAEDIPDFIACLFTYIKTGRYDSDLLTDDNIQYGVKLASSNQKVIKGESIWQK